MEPLPDNTIPIRFAFHMKFISYLKSSQCASQFHNNNKNTIYNHHMIYGRSLRRITYKLFIQSKNVSTKGCQWMDHKWAKTKQHD